MRDGSGSSPHARGVSERSDARSSLRGERESRGWRGRTQRSHDDSGAEGARRAGRRGEAKWERLKRVQEATHKMLERLDKVVSKVAAAKEAERNAALDRFSRESRRQIGALASEVCGVVWCGVVCS